LIIRAPGDAADVKAAYNRAAEKGRISGRRKEKGI
jgi:hypothetical protein